MMKFSKQLILHFGFDENRNDIMTEIQNEVIRHLANGVLTYYDNLVAFLARSISCCFTSFTVFSAETTAGSTVFNI